MHAPQGYHPLDRVVPSEQIELSLHHSTNPVQYVSVVVCRHCAGGSVGHPGSQGNQSQSEKDGAIPASVMNVLAVGAWPDDSAGSIMTTSLSYTISGVRLRGSADIPGANASYHDGTGLGHADRELVHAGACSSRLAGTSPVA